MNPKATPASARRDSRIAAVTSLDALLHYLDTATTTELIEIERSGIPSEVIRELAASVVS